MNESTDIKNGKCDKEKFECINRLVFVMNYYHSITQNKMDDEKDDNTFQHAFNKLAQYNLELLLRDYLHRKEFHNNNHEIKHMFLQTKCVEQCLFWNRKNLTRTDFEDKTYEFVKEMYFSYNSNEIEIQRLLDIMHCDIFHSKKESMIQTQDKKESVLNYDEIDAPFFSFECVNKMNYFRSLP